MCFSDDILLHRNDVHSSTIQTEIHSSTECSLCERSVVGACEAGMLTLQQSQTQLCAKFHEIKSRALRRREGS